MIVCTLARVPPLVHHRTASKRQVVGSPHHKNNRPLGSWIHASLTLFHQATLSQYSTTGSCKFDDHYLGCPIVEAVVDMVGISRKCHPRRSPAVLVNPDAAHQCINSRSRISLGAALQWVLSTEFLPLKRRGEPHILRQSIDRKSTRLNSSHSGESRMPSSA